MLELKNICYRVDTPEGTVDILNHIDLVIPDHKLVVFTGPNGGGKTTLAKVHGPGTAHGGADPL